MVAQRIGTPSLNQGPEKDYLAHVPGNMLTDPAFLQEREGVVNRIVAKWTAIKNRISGPALSIVLLPPREAAIPFPWRPVLEHLANLPGIGELLPAGDLLWSQMGQLPWPLGWTSQRMAQWFNLCSTIEPFFIETADIVSTIAPALHMWEMYALMHWVHEIARSERPPCFNIQDMAMMLAQWQHNPEGVPTAIWQENDSSLNTSDVDIWMWLRAITLTKGVMMQQCIMLKVWESKMINSIMNWERVDVQFHNSSRGLRDTIDVMEERERCGESDNSQKVQHTIVALREIADKAWELVNSRNKWLNNGEWMGWNQ